MATSFKSYVLIISYQPIFYLQYQEYLTHNREQKRAKYENSW